MLVNKKLILCYIVAVSSFLNAMKLSEIPQLNKLENYNEIKNGGTKNGKRIRFFN